MLIFFSAAFIAHQSRNLELIFDPNNSFRIIETTEMSSSGVPRVLTFPKGVLLLANGASYAMELKRVDNALIVTFRAPDGKGLTPIDSIEYPLVSEKPILVSYDSAAKRYKFTFTPN